MHPFNFIKSIHSCQSDKAHPHITMPTSTSTSTSTMSRLSTNSQPLHPDLLFFFFKGRKEEFDKAVLRVGYVD
jgi:hypothetical protein